MSVKNKKEKIIFLLGIILIILLGNLISALEGCCVDREAGYYNDVSEKNKCPNPGEFYEGIPCDDLSSTEKEFYPKGCCIDYNNKICSSNTLEKYCEKGLDWDDTSEECEIVETQCIEGCCVVNGRGYPETKMECNAHSGWDSFRTDLSEDECKDLIDSAEKGACIDRESCTYGTKEECSGKFKSGKYCSDIEVKKEGVFCEAHQNGKGCWEGDIYWFDGCGQHEEIWDDKKTTKVDGDCNDYTETCKFEGKDYTCVSLDCYDKQGNLIMKNGESECFYEGELWEEGYDRVGSIHWRKTCSKGEINYINCGDGRKGICQQRETKYKNSDETYTQTYCVANYVEECFDINSRYSNKEITFDEMKEECEKSDYCNTNFIEEGICSPNNPREWEGSCESFSKTCIVSFKQKANGRWWCEKNCECLGENIFKEMNDICISAGDCGMYLNYQSTFGEGLSYEPNEPWKPGTFTEGTIDGKEGVSKQAVLAIKDGKVYFTDKAGQGTPQRSFRVNLGVDDPNGIISLAEKLITNEIQKLSKREKKYIDLIYLDEEEQEILSERIENNIFKDLYTWGEPWKYLKKGAHIPSPATFALSLYGDAAQLKVEYKCLDWQAPAGVKEEDCRSCSDGGPYCTKYKCESIGQNCILADENVENPTCVSKEDNGYAPEITNVIYEEKEISESSNKWALVTNKNCIQEGTVMKFDLKLDEPAQCKFEFKHYSDYKDMPAYYPSNNNHYQEEHSFEIYLPRVYQYLNTEEECNEEDTKCGNGILGCNEECDDGNKNENDACSNYCTIIGNIDLNLTIRCQDIHKNPSEENIVNYCIKAEPDQTAPRVLRYSPENEKTYEYNPGEILLKIYLDEYADCRYDIGNRNYEFMTEMTCGNLESGVMGWPCNATLSESHIGPNKIYIKCKDNYGNLKDNIIYEYTLNRDISEENYKLNYGLIIDEISLNWNGKTYYDGDEITSRQIPSLELKVSTSRGVNNGKSICEYKISSRYIEFKDTNSNVHSQKGLHFNEGKKTIYIKCKDGVSEIGGNISFDLILDQTAPTIDYTSEANTLTVTTNEEATCEYKTTSCDFKIGEGNSFDSMDSKRQIHQTDYNPTIKYYVICADKYGNDRCREIGEGESTGPIITRVYHKSGDLKIKTDRAAICYYGFGGCDFELEGNENSMSSNYVKTHSLDWNSATTYYIKCKDEYAENQDCAIIIQPNSLVT